MKLAFIACVESGYLEGQTVLHCRSIRKFAGRYSNASIYTFQTRNGTELKKATLDHLAELGVSHSSIQTNCGHKVREFANKTFVSAYAEEWLTEDILVFVDSDTVFVSEPLDFDLSFGIDAAVCTADSKYLSSTGQGDPRDELWQKIYRSYSLTDEPFVVTPTGVRTRAFFSSGLVVVRRSAGIFRAWWPQLLAMLCSGVIPEHMTRRSDEISLATVLVSRFDRVKLLDGRYNYLVYRRPALLRPFDRVQLEELIHLHYRFWFNIPGFLSVLQPPLRSDSEILRWLQTHLPLLPERELPVEANDADPWDFIKLNASKTLLPQS
jgi:hypothetical protein